MGVKGQKIAQIKNKNNIPHAPCIKNSIAHDNDFWYIVQNFQAFFFIFSEF